MYTENINEIYNLKVSNNLEIEFDYEISKEELEEELRDEKSIEYLMKLSESQMPDIKYDVHTFGYSGFGYSEDGTYVYTPDVVLNKYGEEITVLKREYVEEDEYYDMFGLVIKIPIKSLNIVVGKNQATMSLVKEMEEKLVFNGDCTTCINSESELEFNIGGYNNVAITDFPSILRVMSFTKKEVEEVLVKNGILKAECKMEFEMHPM